MLYPLFKDVIFGGASIGKRLLGLKIVDEKSAEKPKVAKLVVRNILFYIPFVSMIVFFATNGKSLGDLLGSTLVVEK